MSHDFSFASPPTISSDVKKKTETEKLFPIITAYNPTKAKITVKTFPLVENAFSMFSQELSEELYVRAPPTIMWRKTYRFKTLISPAQHFGLSDSRCERKKNQPRKIIKSFSRWKTFLWLLLNFYH